jgi:hypothetical protein
MPYIMSHSVWPTQTGSLVNAEGDCNLPSFAESHECKPVEECKEGTLRSLGEG